MKMKVTSYFTDFPGIEKLGGKDETVIQAHN